MFKRGLSLAVVTMLTVVMTFASFGGEIKKNLNEQSVEIIEPKQSVVLRDNLTISVRATVAGDITMTLYRLDGKDLIMSVDNLKTLTPVMVFGKDYTKENDRAVKEFVAAYEKKVKAGIELNKLESKFAKVDTSKKLSDEDKRLKAQLDKVRNAFNDASDDYDLKAASFLKLTEVEIFTESFDMTNKLPIIKKTLDNIKPGTYKLVVRSEENKKIVDSLEFTVRSENEMIEEIKNSISNPALPVTGGK